ncbi:MAG TPA: alpha/beta fold hydrolase [Usitatibacteraceae bacterium]|nr:alpha/beta fold hydrolase [Usitatibacteraceae bacterium]
MAKLNLLLVPGLLCDQRLWQAQVEGLVHAAECKVADVAKNDSIAAMARSAIAKMPPGPFAVAGLSMGGYVALEIHAQAAARVIGLALLDTNARADTEQATDDRRRMMKMAETDFERVVNALIPKLLLPLHQRDAKLLATVKAMAASTGKEAYCRQQEAIIGRTDSRPRLAQVKCPTLILCGKEDVLTPVALHQEMANAIAGSRLVVAEQCGHLSTLEQPRLVTLNLVHWLSGLKA